MKLWFQVANNSFFIVIIDYFYYFNNHFFAKSSLVGVGDWCCYLSLFEPITLVPYNICMSMVVSVRICTYPLFAIAYIYFLHALVILLRADELSLQVMSVRLISFSLVFLHDSWCYFCYILNLWYVCFLACLLVV